MTKDRPILFSGAMVRAILDGRKTQTRRVVKHGGATPPDWATFAEELSQLKYDLSAWVPSGIFMWSEEQTPGQPLKPLRRWPCEGDESDLPGPYAIHCPYGKPGDRLWVRETTRSRAMPNLLTGDPTNALCGEYSVDSEPVLNPDGFDLAWWYSRRTCPAIHMPRWACRLELEVTGVRVERLNNCSEDDAEAEGIAFLREVPDVDETLTARQLYECLWDSINGAGAWAANPWVWVVEFKRVAA